MLQPMIRPSSLFATVLILLLVALFFCGRHAGLRAEEERAIRPVLDALVLRLGLTDLCLATEARYTRHPALSDELAPFMYYPAALEYFPSGLFWAPQ